MGGFDRLDAIGGEGAELDVLDAFRLTVSGNNGDGRP
jgi:hypothetical protein